MYRTFFFPSIRGRCASGRRLETSDCCKPGRIIPTRLLAGYPNFATRLGSWGCGGDASWQARHTRPSSGSEKPRCRIRILFQRPANTGRVEKTPTARSGGDKGNLVIREGVKFKGRVRKGERGCDWGGEKRMMGWEDGEEVREDGRMRFGWLWGGENGRGRSRLLKNARWANRREPKWLRSAAVGDRREEQTDKSTTHSSRLTTAHYSTPELDDGL